MKTKFWKLSLSIVIICLLSCNKEKSENDKAYITCFDVKKMVSKNLSSYYIKNTNYERYGQHCELSTNNDTALLLFRVGLFPTSLYADSMSELFFGDFNINFIQGSYNGFSAGDKFWYSITTYNNREILESIVFIRKNMLISIFNDILHNIDIQTLAKKIDGDIMDNNVDYIIEQDKIPLPVINTITIPPIFRVNENSEIKVYATDPNNESLVCYAEIYGWPNNAKSSTLQLKSSYKLLSDTSDVIFNERNEGTYKLSISVINESNVVSKASHIEVVVTK